MKKISDAEIRHAIRSIARGHRPAGIYTRADGNTGRRPSPERMKLARDLFARIKAAPASKRQPWVEMFNRLAPWVVYNELHDPALMGRKLTQDEKRTEWGVWPSLVECAKRALADK